jgi:hypothetical protein
LPGSVALNHVCFSDRNSRRHYHVAGGVPTLVIFYKLFIHSTLSGTYLNTIEYEYSYKIRFLMFAFYGHRRDFLKRAIAGGGKKGKPQFRSDNSLKNHCDRVGGSPRFGTG